MKLTQLKLLLQTWRNQLTIILLLLILVGFLGYRVGNWALFQQQQQLRLQLQQLQTALEQSERLLAEQRKQADYLTAELAVEKSTVALQQQDLKAEQQKLFDTRKELAFYQKIISPDLQANSLIIDSFAIIPAAAAGRYRFNLVLIEQDKQKNFAKGQISMTMTGVSQGKNKRLDLLQLAGLTKADRRFSFKHFQIFDHEFKLPDGFTPKQLEVEITVPAARGNKAAKVNKTLLWHDLVAGEILE
jgi:type II secretory pathway pseudopilin PulG